VSAVIDASVFVAALTDEGGDGAWAESILAAGGLNAPQLVYAESANVLRRLEAARNISRADASAAFEDLMTLSVTLHPFDAFADRIWEMRHNLTSYDAWYVAVAESLSLPLATLDARLMRAKIAKCKFLTR
jgi:predicted nucleic acid-binding protein